MKSDRIQLLKITFGETLKKCEGHNDDRSLFVNMVRNLAKAVEEFESLNIESPIIKVSFSKGYDEIFDELTKLEQSLKERNMI